VRRFAVAVSCALLVLISYSCAPAVSQVSQEVSRGKTLVSWYGCEACHQIPGIRTARGRVGPPLDGMGRRAYISGRLPNTPENLRRWIRHPEDVDAQTLMPNTGVTEQDSHDIAAFLSTLH
jgi:cytochrome c2